MSYTDLLRLTIPEIIIVLAALALLAVDLLMMRDLELKFRSVIGAMIACLGCVASIAWMAVLPANENFLNGTLTVNNLTSLVKTGLLVFAILTILLSLRGEFTTHVGEYFALILFATVGMMFLVSSEDILMIFISLELTSLSLYILTGFNKQSHYSAEAGLKYFLFGGLSAAFTLFGLSFLFGLSGSTNLQEIAKAIHGPGLDPLLEVAIVMVTIGFGFKVAAAPFHLWAPDAYQGAPLPSAAFIASGSKLAGFFVFARVMSLSFTGAEGSSALHAYHPGWVPLLALIAALSMLVGNLGAIVQSSVRRLLAYSAIAHSGYMLLGVVSNSSAGLGGLVYYVVTYGLATLGAFGVVSLVQAETGSDHLSAFAGLSRTAPALALCMLVFMLSLAGIPPLAGFFGKWYLFAGALASSGGTFHLLWLVMLALALSAVSLFYYLQVLKQIYVADTSGPTIKLPMAKAPIQAVLAVIALAVLLLGCVPEWAVAKLNLALQLAKL